MSHKITIHTVSEAEIVQLSVKLKEKRWEEINSILQLRRHLTHYTLPSRILPSLWLAVIYLAIEQAGTAKVTAILEAEAELGVKGGKDTISKHRRAGRAAWRVISTLGPGVLALVDLSYPFSEGALDSLLRHTELTSKGAMYQQHVQEVFVYLVEFLEEKRKTLYGQFSTFLKNVSMNLNLIGHQEVLAKLDLGISQRCSQPSVSLEMAFNKCTHICFVIPYGSEIFLRVMSGDTETTKELLLHNKASIFDVDPFGLPLLYYGAFYCVKRKGIFAAIAMCAMLTGLGADIMHSDEVGNTPLDILVECCLVEWAKRSDNTALVMLSGYHGKSSMEIIDCHILAHGLGEIHKVLLGLHPMGLQLEEYLQSLPPQLLAESIDNPDSHGRSPLIYAVEHGLHCAVQTLVAFGANVNGLRLGDTKMLTPLHLVFAGPAQDATMHVARILIENRANVDFRDSDGWTALLVAASWENYIGMAMLFEAGADITAQSYYGESVETLSADPEILTKFWDVVLSPNPPEPT